MSEMTARILVFSADIDKRHAVVNGVGIRAAKDLPTIEWSEAATPFGTKELVENNDFDLLILDAETTKEGGMSVAQELKNTVEKLPPIIFLTARQQDSWLATWAGAAATISDPLDPSCRKPLQTFCARRASESIFRMGSADRRHYLG